MLFADVQVNVGCPPLHAYTLFKSCHSNRAPQVQRVVCTPAVPHCVQVAALRSSLPTPDDPQLPRLNTLAAIAGAYFGQEEQLVGWVSDLELP